MCILDSGFMHVSSCYDHLSPLLRFIQARTYSKAILVEGCPLKYQVSSDYPTRIKKLRGKYGLTQANLGELLGVSFATINRWENGKTKPTFIAWQRILHAEAMGLEAINTDFTSQAEAVKEDSEIYGKEPSEAISLDFSANPEVVRLVAEGERLGLGHLFNPVFATEISLVHPLPHQRVAVYDYLLKEARLRFMLADDAGAGKTIMSGLYIREMLARRFIKRILVVPPAGLLGNWERELRTLFDLRFHIVRGMDSSKRFSSLSHPPKEDDSRARFNNPFEIGRAHV